MMRTQMKTFLICICALMTSLGALAEKSYLDNGQVRLGVDLERGGTICFLSTGQEAEADNMVNIHDLGRYIQQSYYAGDPVDRKKDGQHEAYSPWTWNPIQAGGIGSVSNPPHPNAKAEIIEHKQDEDFMYIKCIPRLWDMPGEAAECVFEQWMTLEGPVVRVSKQAQLLTEQIIHGKRALCAIRKFLPSIPSRACVIVIPTPAMLPGAGILS